MKGAIVLASIVALASLLAAGCATAPKGPTDEEMIAKRLQDGIAAIKAKDWSAFDGMVSPSFSSYAVGDKAALLDYLKNADSSGFLDDLEVDLSGAKTTVPGNTATVAPVAANGDFGSITSDSPALERMGFGSSTALSPVIDQDIAREVPANPAGGTASGRIPCSLSGRT